ncbi:MAG: Fe-S-binding domain-containing protein, partial [Acidobacteriota bacterium]
SSIGLPGLNGFVGEVLILMGTFASSKVFGSLAALGMILGAVYMLWMYQRVFLGKIENEENAAVRDINLREKLILLPIILIMLWIGVYSGPFLSRMEPAIAKVQQRIDDARSSRETYRVQQLSGVNLEVNE